MTRRLALTAALLALVVSAAFAAPMTGKVATIKKQEVRVVVAGKLADWVKKGTKVKFLGMKGTIVGVAADTVSISSPKASTTKVGASVSFDKAVATATGC